MAIRTDRVKTVPTNKWALLKSVVGKHLLVTIKDVDEYSEWGVQPRSGRVKWFPTGSFYNTQNKTAYIPKNKTWPSGGIWINVPSNEKSQVEVTFDFRSGQDALGN